VERSEEVQLGAVDLPKPILSRDSKLRTDTDGPLRSILLREIVEFKFYPVVVHSLMSKIELGSRLCTFQRTHLHPFRVYTTQSSPAEALNMVHP